MAGEVAKGFKFEPGGIGGIFKAHRLKVPTFQREYAWEDEQVDQLLQDLNRAKSDNADYFLGTIVTIDKGKSGPLEIVDGQQRLTTTALLITTIREVQADLGQSPQVIESINTEFLSQFDRKTGGHVPKLVLNIDDNEFFSGLVTGVIPEPTRESHRRLLAAYKLSKSFVRTVISTFSEADKPGVLNDWLEFIEHGASVILVRTDDASKAFKMFETLNDRGLKTSQADLVKSYLFGQAELRIEEAQSRWSSMKDNLEEISDDDRAINFLRHSMIATRVFVRAEEVYDKVQNTFRGTTNALNFLNALEQQSRVYIATYQPSAAHWQGYPESATKALTTFNKFDLKPARPLVLALTLKYSANEFDKAIRLLASICVRLVIASRTRSGSNEQAFATAALDVSEGRISTISQLKVALKNVIVSDADFRSEFERARSSKTELARYYLRALESANADEKEPWYVPNDDPKAINLEHILPQNPRDGEWAEFSDEDRRQFTKRIGNLCLLNNSGNSDIGNLPYDKKKKVLAAATYPTTSMTAKWESWTPQAIEERQKELAGLAIKAWPL